jgi:predicted alpha/beta superfamily hydrolase
MLFRIIFFILIVLWINTSFGQDPVVIGQKKVIHSNILKEDRTYQIYLPQSYDWAVDRYYPVLYVLDGESNFIHTTATVDFLSSTSEIPELIVVAITSTVRVRDFTQTDWPSHWIGGGGANNFKNFLSKELIPEIEKNYRANKFRILTGHSAGGQFALYTLSSEPSLFNAYFSISPSLDWDNNLPQRSLEESFEHTDSLKAFLYFAWSDDLGEALANDQRLLKTLETKSPNKFRWVGKGYPDETHVSITLPAQIDALRQLYAGYRLHNDLLVNGFDFAEKHFEKVSSKVRYIIHVPEDVINNFGYEALNNGNIQEAMDFFKRNIEQNPNSANAFDSMADAYEEAGMWDEALKSSERAVELANKYGDPGLNNFIKHTNRIKEKYKPNEK